MMIFGDLSGMPYEPAQYMEYVAPDIRKNEILRYSGMRVNPGEMRGHRDPDESEDDGVEDLSNDAYGLLDEVIAQAASSFTYLSQNRKKRAKSKVRMSAPSLASFLMRSYTDESHFSSVGHTKRTQSSTAAVPSRNKALSYVAPCEISASDGARKTGSTTLSFIPFS